MTYLILIPTILPHGTYKDEWGRHHQITADTWTFYLLRSYGPDKRRDTEDDIGYCTGMPCTGSSCTVDACKCFVDPNCP